MSTTNGASAHDKPFDIQYLRMVVGDRFKIQYSENGGWLYVQDPINIIDPIIGDKSKIQDSRSYPQPYSRLKVPPNRGGGLYNLGRLGNLGISGLLMYAPY